jgi:ribonuclease HII
LHRYIFCIVLYFERKFKREGKDLIIGIDEAGRGPLAGPVVAAAVILKTHSFKNRIDDSKKLTPQQRERAFLEIAVKSVFGIGIVNEKVIDEVNIYQATLIAMELAVEQLMGRMGHVPASRVQVLVDGNVSPKIPLPCLEIIKGDGRSKSIAAASILAKVTRDRIMDVYDQVFPQYGFRRHKGYSTDGHRLAIRQFGRSIIHRKSFTCE